MSKRNDHQKSQLKVRNINEGHRKRLRDRFIKSGLDGFLDYEIVELLLTLGTPRKDCKQIAKEAIKVFDGLRGVLDATLDELQSIKGIGPSNAIGIILFQPISELYEKTKISPRLSLTTPREVSNYLRNKLRSEKREHFISLLVDSKSHMIRDYEISIGTLNESIVHPREVFEPAIKYSASGIIIAHNHPSGNLEPSIEDIKITQRLKSVGDLIGIKLIDHLIITSEGYNSFREKSLL